MTTELQKSWGQARQAARDVRLAHVNEIIEIARMQAQAENLSRKPERAQESAFYLGDQWASFWSDRIDRLRYDPYMFSVSSYYDRRYGRFVPVFQTEQELNILRMASRILANTNNYAQSFLANLTRYVVGTGFTYEPRTKRDPATRQSLDPSDYFADFCKDLWEDFQDRNSWYGDDRPGVEEEFFLRWPIDGEAFAMLFCDPDTGLCDYREIEPEQVVQPPGGDYQTSAFGILNPKDDTQKPEAAWIFFTDHASDGSYFPFVHTSPDHFSVEDNPYARLLHFRRNTPRTVKRGCPDFVFDTYDNFLAAAKLRRNMGQGAAVQAAYAIVREHEAVDQVDVSNMADALADFQRVNPLNGNLERFRRSDSATYDVPQGMKYVAPPSAQNGAAHIEILNSALLVSAGAKWGSPPWMVGSKQETGGMTSGQNMEVAESPWVRAVESAQAALKKAFEKIFWQVIRFYIQVRGPVKGRSYEEIKQLVECHCEPKSVVQRDKDKQAATDLSLMAKKIKSPQQIRAELGIDSDEADEQIREWEEEHGPIEPGPMPGPGGQNSPGGGQKGGQNSPPGPMPGPGMRAAEEDDVLGYVQEGDDGDLCLESGRVQEYDPDEPRDEAGKWTDSGGGTAVAERPAPKKAPGKAPGPFSTAREASRWARDNVHTEGGVSAAEQAALDDYQGHNHFRAINGLLRRGESGIKGPAAARARVAVLDEVLSRSTVHEAVTVQRGAGWPGAGEFFRQAKGKTFHDAGFVSTSADNRTGKLFAGMVEDARDRVLCEVRVPAGSKGYFYHDAGESELLLARGCLFRVDAVKEDSGLLRVKMTLLAQGHGGPAKEGDDGEDEGGSRFGWGEGDLEEVEPGEEGQEGYDPGEARDLRGRWTHGGGGGASMRQRNPKLADARAVVAHLKAWASSKVNHPQKGTPALNVWKSAKEDGMDKQTFIRVLKVLRAHGVIDLEVKDGVVTHIRPGKKAGVDLATLVGKTVRQASEGWEDEPRDDRGRWTAHLQKVHALRAELDSHDLAEPAPPEEPDEPDEPEPKEPPEPPGEPIEPGEPPHPDDYDPADFEAAVKAWNQEKADYAQAVKDYEGEQVAHQDALARHSEESAAAQAEYKEALKRHEKALQRAERQYDRAVSRWDRQRERLIERLEAAEQALLAAGGVLPAEEGVQEAQEADDWITIGGHAEGDKKHVGGTPVHLDAEGKIDKGPAALKGKKISELGEGGGKGLREPTDKGGIPAGHEFLGESKKGYPIFRDATGKIIVRGKGGKTNEWSGEPFDQAKHVKAPAVSLERQRADAAERQKQADNEAAKKKAEDEQRRDRERKEFEASQEWLLKERAENERKQKESERQRQLERDARRLNANHLDFYDDAGDPHRVESGVPEGKLRVTVNSVKALPGYVARLIGRGGKFGYEREFVTRRGIGKKAVDLADGVYEVQNAVNVKGKGGRHFVEVVGGKGRLVDEGELQTLVEDTAEEKERKANLKLPPLGPAVDHEVSGERPRVGEIILIRGQAHRIESVGRSHYWDRGILDDMDDFNVEPHWSSEVKAVPVPAPTGQARDTEPPPREWPLEHETHEGVQEHIDPRHVEGKRGHWVTIHGTHVFVSDAGEIQTGPLKGRHVDTAGDTKGKAHFHARRAAHHRKMEAAGRENLKTAQAQRGGARPTHLRGHEMSIAYHAKKATEHEARARPPETPMARKFGQSPFARLRPGQPPVAQQVTTAPKRPAAAKGDAPAPRKTLDLTSKGKLEREGERGEGQKVSQKEKEPPRGVELLADTKAGPVHTKYDVAPVQGGFNFERQGGGSTYHVRVEGGKVTGCSCPDSRHRSGANCKHCREARRILAETQAPEKPAAKPARKAPHEMTFAEFRDQPSPSGAAGFGAKRATLGEERFTHRHHVSTALARGQHVPPEVLKDYPELAPARESADDLLGRMQRFSAQEGFDPSGAEWVALTRALQEV